MTRKAHQLFRKMILKVVNVFEEKFRVMPSVTAPGDTNPSDAIEHAIPH